MRRRQQACLCAYDTKRTRRGWISCRLLCHSQRCFATTLDVGPGVTFLHTHAVSRRVPKRVPRQHRVVMVMVEVIEHVVRLVSAKRNAHGGCGIGPWARAETTGHAPVRFTWRRPGLVIAAPHRHHHHTTIKRNTTPQG